MSIAVRLSVAVDRMNFRPQLDRDVRFCAELLDQIVGHAVFQRLAPDDEGHLARVVGKMQRRLTGRVSGADEIDVLPMRGAGFAARGAIIDALADEPIEARRWRGDATSRRWPE